MESSEDSKLLTSTSDSPKFQISCGSDLAPLGTGKCSIISLRARGPTVRCDSLLASGTPGARKEVRVRRSSLCVLMTPDNDVNRDDTKQRELMVTVLAVKTYNELAF